MKDEKIDYSHLINALPKLTRKDEKYFKQQLKLLKIHNIPQYYELDFGKKEPNKDEFSLLDKNVIIDKVPYDIYLKNDPETGKGNIYLHELPAEEDR